MERKQSDDILKFLLFVVTLFCRTGPEPESVPRIQFGNGVGSAFAIAATDSHTYFATAKHCIRDDSQWRPTKRYFSTGTITTTNGTRRSGTNQQCEVVWRSPTKDIAIIRSQNTGAKTVTISDRLPEAKDSCVFVGWPSGYCLATVQGTIIKPGRLTASPIGGFSGGPLLIGGKAVGVIVARRDDGVGIYEPIAPIVDWLEREGIR